jgi:two-component system, NarL family, invasion response regulator UvrY
MDIYLVDDHALLRDSLRSLLVARGHRVVGEASSAVQAIAELQALNPDLVLLDMQLGKSPALPTGLAVLQALQAMRHRARVLVLTMWAAPRHVSQALQAGATGYALKGISADELHRALQCVQQGQRYLSPELAGLPELQAQGPAAEGTAWPGGNAAATHPHQLTEAEALQSLSSRERQILLLVVQGHSSSAIGAQLELSPKTVESYRSRLMDKLALSDVPALVHWAVRNGLLLVG